jgi:hypothetical protein
MGEEPEGEGSEGAMKPFQAWAVQRGKRVISLCRTRQEARSAVARQREYDDVYWLITDPVELSIVPITVLPRKSGVKS